MLAGLIAALASALPDWRWVCRVIAALGAFRVPGEIIDAQSTAKIATPVGLANFLLSGLALIVSFNLNLRRAKNRCGDERRFAETRVCILPLYR